MTRYNTNLAAEFYVLSMLHRLGIDASLTLGNKKAVDIVVAYEDGTLSTIEVKGLEKRYDWPADNIKEFEKSRHFYVLVSFEGKIEDPLTPPNAWIIPANKLAQFRKQYKTRIVISNSLVRSQGEQFKNNWKIITSP